MILISLLLVLALERALHKQPVWHIETHLSNYLSWAGEQHWISRQTPTVQLVIQIALPVIITYAIAQWLFGGFISFILQSVMLFLCLGSEKLRATYRSFLQAAERGDKEACYLYTEQLGHCTQLDIEEGTTTQGKSFGQHLLWLNYQHYAAVIIFFTVFGAAGAMLYVTSRECFRTWCENDNEQSRALAKWQHVLDYVPVRITAFGLLLVGHFSRALPVWLTYLTHPGIANEKVLTEVASNAEDVVLTEAQQADPSCEPKAMVTLAKRNIMLLLSLIAILTMLGVVN
ncbi:beta-lactamase regulator AmpE [Alteromonas gilva]|uniref:Beta-lactamase regulator AmpE n=1 Tax=Alteromonas gilva TaxID=2987522 RepID=A0ABT5L1A6_9ALTE|nr:beta-lactamase regulator AmpE [Alteromonas gilva]MDC8830181.1 beta-lactamase regulator AmpE [Alteromonas gilva]